MAERLKTLNSTITTKEEEDGCKVEDTKQY